MLVSLAICLLASAAVTQAAVLSTTIYLHRTATHKALELHPGVAWLFKCVLWITTGLTTREWVAVHRKHHAFRARAWSRQRKLAAHRRMPDRVFADELRITLRIAEGFGNN